MIKLKNLARDKGFPIVFKGIEWTSTSEDCTALQFAYKSKVNRKVPGKKKREKNFGFKVSCLLCTSLQV